MTEDDKREIVERLTLEQELRRTMAGEPKRKSPWEALNSGFALLVLGSVVSAFLVPHFERNARQEEWRRTTLADNAKYRLEMMRKGLQSLTLLGAGEPETMSLFGEVKDEPKMTEAAYQAYRKRLRELGRKRYEDVAGVRAGLVYFERQDAISPVLTDYFDASSAGFESVTRYLDLRRVASDAKRVRNLNTAIPEAMKGVNAKYVGVTKMLVAEIEDQEKRYEKLDF